MFFHKQELRASSANLKVQLQVLFYLIIVNNVMPDDCVPRHLPNDIIFIEPWGRS